jgi:catechol 2,3-dioxygenase-like lactoylglutathione lyase family enzyme
MNLSTVMLHTGNVEMLDRCRDWYRRLGLPLSHEVPGESYWFDAGPTLLGIHTGDEPVGGVTLYLEVPDVDEAYEHLKADFEFESAPETKHAFSARVAYLLDPVGNRVGLLTPI